MFLFTDSNAVEAPAPAPRSAAPVSQALQNAASESGVSFDYLLRTANRESSLNPAAQARSSSASGLFQFVEQTWLGLVKTEGHRVGLDNAAAYISEVSPGRYTVADPVARQAILDMRKDPDLSARMAGIFTTRNREQLSRAIGREPTGGELYIAHFLGAAGGGGLIRLAAQAPDASAANYFPDAAAANRSIFFDGDRARSAGEVYASLVARHGNGAASASSLPLAQAYAAPEGSVDMNSNGAWSGFRANKGARGGLFDLYRSDGAPVSDAVEKIWTKRSIDNQQTGSFALRPALPAEMEPASGPPVSLMPPKRVAERAAKPMPMTETDTPRRADSAAAASGKVGQPLNLLKFMRLKG
jgi:hypothetical protein